MTRALVLSIAASFSWGTLHAAVVAADSERGAQLFQSLSCVQCHSINGKGGTVGPDLGRRIDRNFTPASLAATMWNHAPTMWASMRARNIGTGDLNEQAAADLFAYFYSARFFEKLGDAGRGKRLFSSKHCSDCHGLTDAKLPEAKPVSQWESMGQPLDLVNAAVESRGDHAPGIRQEEAELAGAHRAGPHRHAGLSPESSHHAQRERPHRDHLRREWPGAVRLERMFGLP